MSGPELIDRLTFLLDAGLRADDRLKAPEGLANYAQAVVLLAGARGVTKNLGSAVDSVLLSGRKFMPSALELVELAVSIRVARTRSVGVPVRGKGPELTMAIMQVEEPELWWALEPGQREERKKMWAESQGYEFMPRALGVRDRG